MDAPRADDVQVSADDGVLTIRLNRPSVRNAVTGAMSRAIADAVDRLDADDTLVVAHVGAQRWEMPRGAGPVRVVLDGPTCEVFTTGGVMGVAVPASAGLRVAVTGGGRAEVHALG